MSYRKSTEFHVALSIIIGKIAEYAEKQMKFNDMFTYPAK